MIPESLTLTRDPLWPWSLPTYGLPALGLVALAILGLKPATEIVADRPQSDGASGAR